MTEDEKLEYVAHKLCLKCKRLHEIKDIDGKVVNYWCCRICPKSIKLRIKIINLIKKAFG